MEGLGPQLLFQAFGLAVLWRGKAPRCQSSPLPRQANRVEHYQKAYPVFQHRPGSSQVKGRTLISALKMSCTPCAVCNRSAPTALTPRA